MDTLILGTLIGAIAGMLIGGAIALDRHAENGGGAALLAARVVVAEALTVPAAMLAGTVAMLAFMIAGVGR